MSCFPLVPLAVHARPAARAGAPALASRAPLCGDAARASMLMDPTLLLPPVFPHTFSAPAAAGWAGAAHDRPDALVAALKSFLSSNNNNLPQWSAPSLWAGLDLAQQQQAIAAQATRMAMSSAAAAAEAANLEMERERAALRLALKRARDSPDPSDSDKGESVHSNPLYDHESSPSGFKAVRSAPRQLFSHHTQAMTSADRAPLAKVAKVAPGMRKEWDSPTSTQRHIECGHCGKLFTRTRNLTRHKRIHTGMKPFVCGVCGKTFNRKDNMVTHCRIHMAQPQQAGVAFE